MCVCVCVYIYIYIYIYIYVCVCVCVCVCVYVCISEMIFRWTLIHTSSIRNNAFHNLTKIKMVVARFVGTGGFLNLLEPTGYFIYHQV